MDAKVGHFQCKSLRPFPVALHFRRASAVYQYIRHLYGVYLECLAAKRPLWVIESRLHSSVQSIWLSLALLIQNTYSHTFLLGLIIFLRWGVFRLP
jgi:hypothetical protein